MGGGKGKGKGKKNKKKSGKSGNPMKREAEEKALRDKLAGKASGGASSGGSAFAKKPQNPALPAGLEQMMGNVDGGTELAAEPRRRPWRTVRSLISQLGSPRRGEPIISRFNLYLKETAIDDNPQRGGNHRTVMDDLKRAARRSRGPYAASVHDCP